MATNTSTILNAIKLLFFIKCFAIHYCQSLPEDEVVSEYTFTPADILDIVERYCFVGISYNSSHRHASQHVNSVNDQPPLLKALTKAFANDEYVIVGRTELSVFTWPSGNELRFVDGVYSADEEVDMVVFPKRVKDRTCLSTGDVRKVEPVGELYNGMRNINMLLEFANIKCNTYRTVNGHLTVEGLHRKEILQNLFYVQNVSDINMKMIFLHSHEEYCSRDSCTKNSGISTDKRNSEKMPSTLKFDLKNTDTNMKKCDKINLPTKDDFFHNYLKISKPVIIMNAMDNWPSLSKWTNEFFQMQFGDSIVHIKLTPSGEFEGVDSASFFENYDEFKIPDDVKQQLLYPDLVVVRPATANMKFSEFLTLVDLVSNGSKRNFSAYMEYSSLADVIPELETDVMEMPFFRNILELKHLNIWLSDGNTLGKLHFDPFDNFLCQISGRKQVILFDPHDNTKLYEAHIPEAMLSYDENTGEFSKKMLLDSTSMVMSPVDMTTPDFERFPAFADTYPLNCTIDEGEVLFMPAFWWHEVQSYPNKKQGRNLAVNYWYDPFLTREFPCQECKLDINPKYRHLV